MNGKRREYVFTYHFDLVRDEVDQKDWDTEAKEFYESYAGNVRICSFQLEACPNTGRLHFQGYIEFENPRSENGVRAVHRGIHTERRRGTRMQAIEYTRKEESRVLGPWWFGSWSYEKARDMRDGKRTDLEDCVRGRAEGKTMGELAEDYPGTMARYYRGVEAMGAAVRSHRRRQRGRRRRIRRLQVLFIYGATGTGKSHRVWNSKGAIDAYDKHPDGKWFDGYNGERTIIYDDFNWSGVPIDLAKRWLDKYPVSYPIKGASADACNTRVVILSNSEPSEWWPAASPTDMAAIERRFTHRVEVPRQGEWNWKKGSSEDWDAFFEEAEPSSQDEADEEFE